jgi:hypothetical protein
MVTFAEDLPSFELDGVQLVRPDFAGRGLANVAPTVLSLLAPSVPLPLPPLAPSVLPEALTRGVSTVVVLVADGLGHLQLEREIAAGNAPRLGALLEQSGQARSNVAYGPITSVFPTTTVAALGSVNSAVAPTSHGLLGYTLYLPEFETVAEMISWRPLNRRASFASEEFGCAPESFFWAPTIYSQLQAAGVSRIFAVNPGHFVGTALTRMLHQGATYQGYISTSSLQPIVARLVEASDEPTYIYAYWPLVDTIAHLVGPLTAEHGAEVAAFDLQLGRLVDSLPRRGRTLLLFTADHGHIDTAPEFDVPLADHPELMAMLRVLPAGERRATYLHPKPGAVDDVVAYAGERLGQQTALLRRDEAVELGLFGPGGLSERAAGRIGDVLLLPKRNLSLVAPPEPVDGVMPRSPAFKGLHGGLSPDEALVPLLAVRC